MASGLWVLLRRELQDIFRSSRALGGLLAAAALAGTSAASLWPAERLAGPRAGATEDLVGIFLQLELLAGLILPSALLAANVATERARNTLDSLLAAPVSPATIMCAKWLAAVAYLALVLLVMLPGLSCLQLLGGVTAARIAQAEIHVALAASAGVAASLVVALKQPNPPRAVLVGAAAATSLLLVPIWVLPVPELWKRHLGRPRFSALRFLGFLFLLQWLYRLTPPGTLPSIGPALLPALTGTTRVLEAQVGEYSALLSPLYLLVCGVVWIQSLHACGKNLPAWSAGARRSQSSGRFPSTRANRAYTVYLLLKGSERGDRPWHNPVFLRQLRRATNGLDNTFSLGFLIGSITGLFLTIPCGFLGELVVISFFLLGLLACAWSAYWPALALSEEHVGEDLDLLRGTLLSGREILAGHALAGVYATSGLLLGMCVAVGCSICVRQLVIRDTFSASLATIGLGWLVLLSAHALGLGASLLAGVTCKTPTAALLRAALLSIVPFVLLVVPARLTGAPRTATGAFALMNFITAACWLGLANLLFTRKYARDP